MEQFKVQDRRALVKDLLIGVVIAFLSIPLSMGYAQVAGLPPCYGLYGSLFPVLAYSLLTSSPRIVFAVDAAPAALVATLLPELGVTPGSADAPAAMAVITCLAGLWLTLFWLLGGGRFSKFVSESVLGGCVSDIATVVILTQFPRLFGGSVSRGRAPVLLAHLFRELSGFHALSFALGFVTVVVILAGRRQTKVSMSVVVMILAIALNAVFHFDRYGVALVGNTPAGLPSPVVPDWSCLPRHAEALIIDSLAVALVIAAETLVSTGEFARRHGEQIDKQRELLAYAAGNLAAALFGSSPVIGSLSRSNRANKLGVGSQWMGVSMFATMGLFLLFGTPLLSYLPVPVLTGIVIGSLGTILEFDLAGRLWKMDRANFLIFAAAFAAEMLGLAEGVLVGVVLSFASFTMRTSAQPSYFLGCMEGHEGFFDLEKTPHARPIQQTVLYQFNGPLFFATIDDFERDLWAAIRPDTTVVVVTGVLSVDSFAAERLLHFYRNLCGKGISFYLAGHAAAVNEQFIEYGAEELIHEGVVRQRLTQALNAGGLTPPYPLEWSSERPLKRRGNAAVEAFLWAYGAKAEARLNHLTRQLAENVLTGKEIEFDKFNPAELELIGEYWNSEDEKEWDGLLEMYLDTEPEERKKRKEAFLALSLGMTEHRMLLERQLLRGGNQSILWEFLLFRKEREAAFREEHPETGPFLEEIREQYMSLVYQEAPEMSDLLRAFAESPEEARKKILTE